MLDSQRGDGIMTKLVKRYARTRLYDTENAQYVTLADLRAWQARGLAFTVIDVETNQDITTVLLA
jgi:polyhydroxyalkanoate synthesis regulator protein